jgi:hypothetical protein
MAVPPAEVNRDYQLFFVKKASLYFCGRLYYFKEVKLLWVTAR